MKKFVALFIYILIAAIGAQTGLSINPNDRASDALERARFQHNTLIEALGQQIEAMRSASCSDVDTKSIMDEYGRLRQAYKAAEVTVEYLDHESIALYFNGPPLKSLEPKVPEIIVLEPEGMQVIDEIIYLADEDGIEREELCEMVTQLEKRYVHLKGVNGVTKLQHHHVWNAMRVSIIRLFSLGITGFDTPGSLMAIEDAVVTLGTIRQYVQIYESLLSELDSDIPVRLYEHIDGATVDLESADDFNSLDRMALLNERINPLFADLLVAQKTLGVAMPAEAQDDLPALNLQVSNLFDPAIYNLDYFTNMEWSAVEESKIELGKTLFFDPVLSNKIDMSCASCHRPEKAFTDGLKTSKASGDKGSVLRNSPTLINCVYSEKYFLDLREEHLERQIKHVVLDSLEFNTDFLEIVSRLETSEEYKQMFAEAYPNTKYQLSKWSVSDALATYVASLTSFDSPVDKYIRGEQSKLPEDVYRGFNVFMGKAACGSCHFAPAFNGTVPPFFQHSESEVLGVPATADTNNTYLDPDPGRIASSRPQDESEIYWHAFKTTTIRNVALTGPYMHNGVYESLEQVIDFYNRGGGLGLGLDVPNQTLPDAPLELTQQEISDLVAFMEAMTDIDGMTETPKSLPRFDQNPEWNTRPIGGSGDY